MSKESMNSIFSDEQLQAFVDDEVDLSDRAEIMEAISRDDELACRVCELLQIKDSVRLAYHEPPQPAHTSKRWQVASKARVSVRAIAASFLLATGILSGWFMHALSLNGASPPTSNIVQMAPANQEFKRVILHISTADTERLEQALDDAELLLSGYKNHPEMLQLEVVVNAAGLTLLREDASPYVDRIRHMAQEYDNIDFLACSRTIEKLHLKGIDVHLIPEAKVIPAALEEIVDKLQEGWVYIRV